MVDHASDCALHNAPATAPAPCTCGASFRFRVFQYDVTRDSFRWCKFCRETLIAEVVGSTLALGYGQPRIVRTSTLIGRALRDGLTPNELARIREAWDRIWEAPERGLLERCGIDDTISGDDGAYLPADRRGELSERPDTDELRAAMAPWLDYWATLPEPTI